MAKQKTKSLIPANYQATGRCRVVIENVYPSVDGGLYPVKRVEKEWLEVQADVFADGHDKVSAILMFREAGTRKWQEARMKDIGGDRYSAGFECVTTGRWEFTIRGFVDHPLSWIYDFRKRLSANDTKELAVQLQVGILLLQKVAKLYPRVKRESNQWIEKLGSEQANQEAAGEALEAFFIKYPLEQFETVSEKVYPVVVHRKRAGFSSWYSFFPRSSAPEGKAHGTFKDCENLLPRISEMGFDVIYLTPIHPIGKAFRKGKNDTLTPGPEDVGSPYAIGSELGGHKAILPELGTLADFKHLVKAANDKGIEIALDYALQCSPDHPYVKEHPQWFIWRPDGSVQYAENPPKKYQDVLPLNFENDDWQNMWIELKSIIDYWIAQGVTIFRVDNPHTKSFGFWEWLLAEVHNTNPEVIFLSEAFTRPKVMMELAKKGYHQSYTYFTWRNSKAELTGYMNDLMSGETPQFFRPNFFTNTHDINPYITQGGSEAQFIIRYFLAATLSSNYGIYGPVFELMVRAAPPGREEYLDSEKYEVRHWDWNARNKLTQLITLINKFRNENEALQFTSNYVACQLDNDQMMAYLKTYNGNRILCIVNLDAWNGQHGYVQVPLNLIGKNPGDSYVVHDLVTGDKYHWQGSSNYVELNPNRLPFHLLRIEES